jgi:hypothetical protein
MKLSPYVGEVSPELALLGKNQSRMGCAKIIYLFFASFLSLAGSDLIFE